MSSWLDCNAHGQVFGHSYMLGLGVILCMLMSRFRVSAHMLEVESGR